MATIYVSYSHQDSEIVNPIIDELRKRGHEIVMDSEVLKVGQDWRKTLLISLKNADGVLVFITENSLKSNYVISEIGAARAIVEDASNRKFLIPILVGDIPIPSLIQDIHCLRLQKNNLEEVLSLIDQSISSFLGKKGIVEEKENVQREKIESKASNYVELAINALKRRESSASIFGTIWYGCGFISLTAGAAFAIYGLQNLDKLTNHDSWIYALVILKSIIIVGLLIACSKYAFNLGKTYMNESLRNADRIHAISFGKFYLQAFSDKISTPEEIKDIFQNWNIDKESAFQKLDANSYDPKITENLVDILKSLSKKLKK